MADPTLFAAAAAAAAAVVVTYQDLRNGRKARRACMHPFLSYFILIFSLSLF